jgi:predicted nucleic acid-binding protein
MTQSKFKDNSGPNGKDSCLLDTNIVLGFLKQQPNLMKLFQLELSGRPYLVSEITRIELLGYPNLTQTEETVIEEFLGFVEILPIHHQ